MIVKLMAKLYSTSLVTSQQTELLYKQCEFSEFF